MSMSTGTLPFDVNELGSGGIRVLIQPIGTVLTKTFKDWFAQSAPYAPIDPAYDLGATSGPATYDRAITVAGLKIEQQDSAVLERVTDVVRTLVVPMANINPANLQMFENGQEVIAAVAAAGYSAVKRIPFGAFVDVTQYRVLFVGQKLKSQGSVQEPITAKLRGRFEGLMAYRAQLTAATGQMSFGAGALVSMPVTFKLFPEGAEAQGEEYGSHLLEDAGVIA